MRMTHTFKPARRAARFRAPLLITFLALTFGACNTADKMSNTTSTEPTDPTILTATPTAEASLEDSLAVEDSLALANGDPTGGMPLDDGDEFGIGEEDDGVMAQALEASNSEASLSVTSLSASLIVANRRGIPFGTFHLPPASYGRPLNGNITTLSPYLLLSYLSQAKRTGTRVILSFSGNEKTFQNANRSFSLSKWQARIRRFHGINFTSYINDGTIIGHYLIDEPSDPTNWGGRLVSRATLDAMARYSKQLWPRLPTVVRAPPKYLKGYKYRYLDAAWAQYHSRFGSPAAYIATAVRDAKAAGLQLVTGMNSLAGSNSSGLRGYYSPRGNWSMTASQVRTWGGAIMANTYPCAFLNWRYNQFYQARSDIKSAYGYLLAKARARTTKSCRAR